jgi:hypothetical protein
MAARPPRETPDQEFPTMLTTARLDTHSHSMTRTGTSPRVATYCAVRCAPAANSLRPAPTFARTYRQDRPLKPTIVETSATHGVR